MVSVERNRSDMPFAIYWELKADLSICGKETKHDIGLNMHHCTDALSGDPLCMDCVLCVPAFVFLRKH